MLHACVRKFDVMVTVANFCEVNGASDGAYCLMTAHSRQCGRALGTRGGCRDGLRLFHFLDHESRMETTERVTPRLLEFLFTKNS